uniref:Uncharacterized protein n=1 Tax=Timema douglasi TaxID=61478 RepID=A0A7R8VH23_TIMDO|nr:unnamed protein product [Timema douglasi]
MYSFAKNVEMRVQDPGEGTVSASGSSFPECRQIAGFKQTLEEKLGIPVKPKKPLTPFFRFMGQIRPTVVQQHPGAKVTGEDTISSP